MPISLPGPTFKEGDLVYYKGSTLGDTRQDLWRIVEELGSHYRIQNERGGRRRGRNMIIVSGRQLIKANISTPPSARRRNGTDVPSPDRIMGKTRRRRKNKSKKSRPKSIKSKGKRKGKGKRKKTRR